MELLPEKPNKTIPQFVRPESAGMCKTYQAPGTQLMEMLMMHRLTVFDCSDLREATRLLESISNAKNTYQVRASPAARLQLAERVVDLTNGLPCSCRPRCTRAQGP